jgi:RNA polymerase sigma-70 factor (ECF subfamily)
MGELAERAEMTEHLVRRAVAGDRAAFRQLVERQAPTIFRIALGLVRSHHDAEEAVQETFLRVWRALPRFRGEAGFESWVHRIAVNAAHDQLRRRGRRSREAPAAPEAHPVTISPDPDPERQALSRRLRVDIDRAVLRLTPAEREIFVLRHDAGLSLAEVARALGRAEGTVKSLLFRAVRKLRAELAEYVEPAEVQR